MHVIILLLKSIISDLRPFLDFNRRKFYNMVKIYMNLHFSNSAVGASSLLTKSTGGCSNILVIRLYSKKF